MQITCYSYVAYSYCTRKIELIASYTNILEDVTCKNCLEIAIDEIEQGATWNFPLYRYVNQLNKIKGMEFEEDLNTLINS